MIVVDTSVWIDYLSGARTPQVDWLDLHLTTERLGILDLILCEVLQGVRTEREADALVGQFANLECLVTGGAGWAEAAARNYRFLRAKGRTVRKTIDCLIATYCIDNGHALLHADADFAPFERHLGLHVVRT